MRATVMYGAGDVRIEDVPDPRLTEPTDALVRVTHACICGSDLWPYRTMEHIVGGRRVGHEAIGVVEELLPDILEGRIEPGRVFDRAVGLDEVPDGYRAMNDREAIKVLIEP